MLAGTKSIEVAALLADQLKGLKWNTRPLANNVRRVINERL